MKINLEINNATSSPVEDAFFMKVAEKTLVRPDFDFLEHKEIQLSVALVPPEEIRRLNNEYRQYDKVTDILSFAEHETAKGLRIAALENSDEELFLGELILCYDDIRKYADEEGLDFKRELAKVVSHGILHLMGFDHGEKMFTLQEGVANEIIEEK